tara:strand:+ start:1208 stop:1606 length:399 start_codon:yes stop_codon:yes gene_type:complete
MSLHEEMNMALPPRGNSPYDAPSAHQLIEAVNILISGEIGEEISPTQKWKLRIASNALGIASREIQNIREDRKALRSILESLQMETEKDLSEAIRAGVFDDSLKDIHAQLVPLVDKKIMVANPSYLIDTNDP